MNRAKRLAAGFLCLLVALSMCACEKGGSGASGSYKSDSGPYAMYSEPAMGAYDYRAEAVANEEYGGLSASAMTSPSGSNSGTPASSSSSVPEDNPEKIIYSGSATLESTEFDKTVEALEKMVAEHGGYIESSSITGSNYNTLSQGRKTNRSASYTIRVPSAEFNVVMNSLPNLGNVPNSHVYTENVTSQYYDTQARLNVYKAQEQRLMELLDMAETVSDVIEVENELTDVRYRIESLQTSLNGWDRRARMSTIDLKVNEVSEYTPKEVKSYGKRMAEAFSNGIEYLGEFLIDFAEGLPVLAVLLLILVIVILIIKKAIRGRKSRKVKKEKEKDMETEEK